MFGRRNVVYLFCLSGTEQCQRIAADREILENEFQEKLRITETQHQTQLSIDHFHYQLSLLP